ncbi:hypothetical protein [Solidesulfovibrio sp.]|uniref:hypothetical protein n=1 Tax=Solidesulfovibrio sp. TaxID=2910990 RepID=UPI002B21B883|nr:hypothetical protein [Solidesulfovibrio sp.]MEA4856276.1 hypothetical protein [Solidesulfovibrio sp.]
MDETTLQQILTVQTAILAELRLLRQALAPGAGPEATPRATPAPAPQPAVMEPPVSRTPSAAALEQPAPPRAPAAPTPPASSGAGAMLTLDELTDLGGQFLDPGQRSRTRVKPVDASDLSSSILDDIKAKNKAKRNAFAEFERFGKDR